VEFTKTQKTNNMNKEFIPYEQAFELKELGFDEQCFGHFSHYLNEEILTENIVSAPLYQQAFRWFREKHNLPSNLELFHIGWDYVIYLNVTEEVDFNEGPWNTYEEAELACLRKLIEIVKNK
jgi:hypothetical protein